MSFMERRISEYKTAPDVRRVKSGGDKFYRSSSPLHRSSKSSAVLSNAIPVHERKKMFEQTDSVAIPTASSGSGGLSVPSSGRRGSKQRKEIGRNSSFRGTKKLKGEDSSHSPVMARSRSAASSNLNSSLWKRLRNFGHFDIQSFAMESLSPSTAGSDGLEHNVKKPTGASAAHEGECQGMDMGGVCSSLVAPCAAFTNEVGGDSDWLTLGNPIMLLRDCLSIDKQRRIGSRERMILDGELPLKSMLQTRGPMNRQVSRILQPKPGLSYPFEFIDYGASYYRNYFLDNEHQNFFGVDENIGPVAISVRRERVLDQISDFYSVQPNVVQPVPKHLYRVILRTSELRTLRGTILEDSIPTGAKTGTSKGIPPRDIVEYISQGELQMSCLKLGRSDKKVLQELVKLDEQELNNKYKIGVIYCKEGQTTEEDIYNNEMGSDGFDEFLELIGQSVRMKGFTKYRAQLDNKTDTTGEYSVYTEYKDTEVMFHVSTLLPHTASNKQQLLRKRHIGNDIVTIIFQEPGCGQFSPRMIRSHFQHIFVVIRVENPNSKYTKYRISVTRSSDIPFFGPPIPEGAVFDKNENFRDFLLTKLINACNASLRNSKFSTMAVRTRRQYLNDLAENSTLAITIDQANTSGRVAGLLRNIGHKKRERTRQLSTLIYTGGALTWHVSLIFRVKKPLPFSEEHDNHIDCILGIAPDIIVFLDYYTKDILLHLPTKDLSGWIIDKTRLNLFYDESFCLSMESLESEEDTRELITRLHSISPKLTISHEAMSMEFHRSSFGFLGFTISEVGVVEKVDGLAKNSGLQAYSRMLQVEDKLLCCHTHKQITDLLTAKDKPIVRAYVIPPAPKGRHLLFYPEMNWPGIWSSRPSHADLEENSKCQNGIESESTENRCDIEKVELRKKPHHARSSSQTNRFSYMEAMRGNETEHGSGSIMIDDNEPIYDRLGETGGGVGGLKSPRLMSPHKRSGSQSYQRVRGTTHSKTNRESVLNLADNIMDRGLTQSLPYQLTPMEHRVEEVEMTSPVQITSSFQLPDYKPHTAAPLAPHHRRSNSKDYKKDGSEGRKKPGVEVTSPITPRGTVSKMAKKFSYPGSQASPPASVKGSRFQTPRQGNSPLKAMASASEMTKSGIPIKRRATEQKIASCNDIPGSPVRHGGHALQQGNGFQRVQMRSSDRKNSSNKGRPASLDMALLLKNEKNMEELNQDEKSSSNNNILDDDNLELNAFHRNETSRKPFRVRSQSREFLESGADESMKGLSDSDLTSESVPRSPTTGALISNSEAEMVMEDEVPEHNEMTLMSHTVGDEEKRLSQNTGSQSSQDSIKNAKLTVRERTQRWEARGGGVPSYFSTLPKSFRHKATDRRKDPAYAQYMAEHEDEYQLDEMMDVADSNANGYGRSSRNPRNSVGSRITHNSGIPLPASKFRDSNISHARGVSSKYKVHQTSVSPDSQGYHQRMHSADDGGRSLNSSGQSHSSNDNSLERRLGEGQEGMSPVRGSGSVTSGRYAGSQVSSRRTGQRLTHGDRHRPSSPPSDSEDPLDRGYDRTSKSSTPHHTSSIPAPPSKRTSIPHNKTPFSPSTNSTQPSTAQRLGETDGSGTNPSPEYQPSPMHERQLSSASLEHSLQELDRNLQDMLMESEEKDSKAHVVEWLRQTSEDALPPDVLAEHDMQLASPISTDHSFNYSPSENSLEVVESLKAKIEYLESRLGKESVDNQDLRDKLLATEQRLYEVQQRRQNKETQSIAV